MSFYLSLCLKKMKFTIEEINTICSFLEIERIDYIFYTKPCPAPRMSQSDKWKVNPDHKDPNKRQRPVVTRYYAFRDSFRALTKKADWQLPEVLNIIFLIEIPRTWSGKKKREHLFKPHKQTPDRDNYLKAVQDTFDVDDGFVWDGRTSKLWSHTAAILVYK